MTLGQFFTRWTKFNSTNNQNGTATNGSSTSEASNGLSILPILNPAVDSTAPSLTNPIDQPQRLTVQRISADVNEDIENLDRLRNRAVIDGVSEVSPDYMMKAIDAYIAMKIAAENTIRDYDNQIEELKASIKERAGRIQELKQPSSEYANKFVFLSVQTILFSFVCLVGFFVIYHTVATSAYFRLSPNWVCFIISVGIGCVGVSNFFVKSTFLGPDKVQSPALRVIIELIEQLGMSLVASVLVMIIALQSQPYGLSISLGLFTFFLSVLGGKLLSGVVTSLHSHYVNYRSYKQVVKNRKEEIKILEQENGADLEKINTLFRDKAQAEVQYIKNRSDIEKLKAQNEFYKEFYMHFFQLARSFKSYLTPEQAFAIQQSAIK